MRRPDWVFHVFSLEARQIVSYRVDFWVNFLGSLLIQMALAYFLWNAVYSFKGVDEMGGYSFRAMMLYYLLVPLMEKIVKGPEMGFISREIYEGSLTRYLVYPVHYFGYKYVSQLAYSALALLQLALALALYLLIFGLPADVTLQPLNVLAGIVAGLAASFLYFNIAASLEMVAFWADNVWSLLVMLRFCIRLLGGGMLPLIFFPEWSQGFLAALPFPYLLSYPIRIFMGHESILSTGWLWLALWSVLSAGIVASIWRRGTLRYTGVGI